MLGFDRITFYLNVMGGRACIRGMRITVSLIINLIANGMSTEEIIDAYPYLEPEDIRQALCSETLAEFFGRLGHLLSRPNSEVIHQVGPRARVWHAAAPGPLQTLPTA